MGRSPGRSLSTASSPLVSPGLPEKSSENGHLGLTRLSLLKDRDAHHAPTSPALMSEVPASVAHFSLLPEFPTTKLEMTAVADIFDRDGDGYIDYYEFVAALHPNKDAYRPTTDADKIEDEVKHQNRWVLGGVGVVQAAGWQWERQKVGKKKDCGGTEPK